MTRYIPAFLAAALLLLPAIARAQQPVKLTRAEVMKQKLASVEKVLAGLALEDYEVIAQNSQRLSLLTLEESWNVLGTPEYRRESDEFRRAADMLTRSAKEKNIDGATLAYLQVTLNCVHCHKLLRINK
jgi:hypothetical protein